MSLTQILTVNSPKTVKGEKLGFLTGILYLAPHLIASAKTICPFSTAGCRAACLFTSGRGALVQQRAARIRRTRLFHSDRSAFLRLVYRDIDAVCRAAARQGLRPAIRLNGTSDILWERIGFPFQTFPSVQFYDYTKIPIGKRRAFMHWIKNYQLTYSVSETAISWRRALDYLKGKGNAAVVFGNASNPMTRNKSWKLPDTFGGFRVVDGDVSDARYLDASGCVIGIRAKGEARKDRTGFVHWIDVDISDIEAARRFHALELAQEKIEAILKARRPGS